MIYKGIIPEYIEQSCGNEKIIFSSKNKENLLVFIKSLLYYK